MECHIESSRLTQRALQLQRIRPRHACNDVLLVRLALSVKILISCSRERLTAAQKSSRRAVPLLQRHQSRLQGKCLRPRIVTNI